MGKFLAAQRFFTHCPTVVMDLPPAAIHDSKARLRETAICDERISLPLTGGAPMRSGGVPWSRMRPLLSAVTASWAAAMVVRIREGGLAQGSQPVPISVATSQPQLTVENVVSVASDSCKRANYSTKFAHVFWGKLECCLELWEYVPKEHGIKAAGGFACKYCDGFWKGRKGSSRVVQLMQLILDEPPRSSGRSGSMTAWSTT